LLAAATGSLGLAAGGTAAALLAVAMTGTDAAAGLALGALAAGQAGASLLVGRLTSRSGRGPGLVLGYVLGVLGAVTVILAAAGGGLLVLVAGSALLGGANAAVFLSRYAAADLGGRHARGRALGTVLVAAAVGTIAGPALLVPTGRLAQALGLPQLTGLYLLAVVAFSAAGLAVAALSRGGLAALGRRSPVVEGRAGGRRPVSGGQLAAALRQPPVRAALVVLGATNLVMVAIMAVTPVLLLHHGHHLGFVGLAVSVHVLGMFAPSVATGWLADRVGGAAVAWAAPPCWSWPAWPAPWPTAVAPRPWSRSWSCSASAGTAAWSAAAPCSPPPSRPSCAPAPRASARPPWAWPPPPAPPPPASWSSSAASPPSAWPRPPSPPPS
jgi:MFS family permease